MSRKLLKEFITEALVNAGFIKHLQNGLGYARGGANVEAQQIVMDWLEECELRDDNLLAPGQVFRIERFVTEQWPVVLEQYRGDKYMALIAMNNMLDAKYNDFR